MNSPCANKAEAGHVGEDEKVDLGEICLGRKVAHLKSIQELFKSKRNSEPKRRTLLWVFSCEKAVAQKQRTEDNWVRLAKTGARVV